MLACGWFFDLPRRAVTELKTSLLGPSLTTGPGVKVSAPGRPRLSITSPNIPYHSQGGSAKWQGVNAWTQHDKGHNSQKV